MKKLLIRLADGSILTRKPILPNNVAATCARYVKKLSLQDYCFDELNVAGEFVRQIKFVSGKLQKASGGARAGSGKRKKPTWKISWANGDQETCIGLTEIELLKILYNRPTRLTFTYEKK